ncbi:hypothetical protein FV228_04955 [Methylobacterium sp. WL18]|uniref:hypothetical protein n=1 Tax=Methylobacterium sp. WL18 TaxID=2603897 RepID=UPI0011CB7002|nr:hypothetical protein [Methylobacterium sp. WL18]TXN74884.1 hypothetical protein FV228_04955 [Methylobacterium sp. WL18]
MVQQLEATDSMKARIEFVRVLGELGPTAVPAVDYLAAVASSSVRTLVREVAEALRRIGVPAGLLTTIQTAAVIASAEGRPNVGRRRRDPPDHYGVDDRNSEEHDADVVDQVPWMRCTI